ncbi:hypothetical protein [Peribacillus asahii]|uniref:hypothetical protein n=1 Tax=Peribacillus asahii TaxID=228899 RepID=UPI003804AE68
MIINIHNPKENRNVELGDVIVARHKIRNKILHYKLIKRMGSINYQLLNLNSDLIMSSFKSANPLDALSYVEVAVKAEILEIIPSNQLQLTKIN